MVTFNDFHALVRTGRALAISDAVQFNAQAYAENIHSVFTVSIRSWAVENQAIGEDIHRAVVRAAADHTDNDKHLRALADELDALVAADDMGLAGPTAAVIALYR